MKSVDNAKTLGNETGQQNTAIVITTMQPIRKYAQNIYNINDVNAAMLEVHSTSRFKLKLLYHIAVSIWFNTKFFFIKKK